MLRSSARRHLERLAESILNPEQAHSLAGMLVLFASHATLSCGNGAQLFCDGKRCQSTTQKRSTSSRCKIADTRITRIASISTSLRSVQQTLPGAATLDCINTRHAHHLNTMHSAAFHHPTPPIALQQYQRHSCGLQRGVQSRTRFPWLPRRAPPRVLLLHKDRLRVRASVTLQQRANVDVEVETAPNNSRRLFASVDIDAPLEVPSSNLATLPMLINDNNRSYGEH